MAESQPDQSSLMRRSSEQLNLGASRDDVDSTDFFLGMRPETSSRSRSRSFVGDTSRFERIIPAHLQLGSSAQNLPPSSSFVSPMLRESQDNILVPNETESRSEREVQERDLDQLNENVLQNISQFVKGELYNWKLIHQKELNDLELSRNKTTQRITKSEKELQRLDQRSLLLTKRIESIREENETLRETISQLENILSNGPDSTVTALTSIKEKLWEGSLQISPEKKRHINLLKKLTQTRFNPTNEKHAALLHKFVQLINYKHKDGSIEDKWQALKSPTGQVGNELDSTGVLGLQNLVYFSERNNALARRMTNDEPYHFPSVGLSVTALLINILNLCSSESWLPVNDITKTFVRLMDHPKAFEELYCVCLRLYDKAVHGGGTDPLKITGNQIRSLLENSPKDLQQFLLSADNL